MSKPQSEFDPEPHLAIIPASPGYRVIHEVEGVLSVDEDIIGWRVQTRWDQGEHHSTVEPVVTYGVSYSPAGTLHPDGSVTYRNHRFSTLEAAQHVCLNF